MKFIFDFDGVIFDAEGFKQKIASVLIQRGISKEVFLKDYSKVHGEGYNVRSHLNMLLKSNNVETSDKVLDEIEECIFCDLERYVKKPVLDFIKIHAKDVYILSAGDFDFQMKKIKAVGLNEVVQEIVIVPYSKKEWLIDFVKEHIHEKVYFFDDSVRHTTHDEFKKYNHFQPVLFTDESVLKNIV